MKTITTFAAFNGRRYSNPWVAIVNNETAKIDFSKKVGGYTGKFGAGEAGELFVINPQEGNVYAFGRKDYRGGNSVINYVFFHNGEFVYIEKTDLISYLNK